MNCRTLILLLAGLLAVAGPALSGTIHNEVAVTGSAASPGIYETLEVAGRDRTLARLARAADSIRDRIAASG